MSRHQIDIDTDLYLQPNTERRTRDRHDYWCRLYEATKNVYDIVSEDSVDVFKSKYVFNVCK